MKKRWESCGITRPWQGRLDTEHTSSRSACKQAFTQNLTSDRLMRSNVWETDPGHRPGQHWRRAPLSRNDSSSHHPRVAFPKPQLPKKEFSGKAGATSRTESAQPHPESRVQVEAKFLKNPKNSDSSLHTAPHHMTHTAKKKSGWRYLAAFSTRMGFPIQAEKKAPQKKDTTLRSRTLDTGSKTDLRSFAYRVQTAHGTIRRGSVRAHTKQEAHSLLTSAGNSVLRLRKHPRFPFLKHSTPKLSDQQLASLIRQIAALLSTGEPLRKSLSAIGEHNPKRLQDAARTLAADLDHIAAHNPAPEFHLSTAMQWQPGVFPRFFVELIRAAESCNDLDTILWQIAAYLERRARAHRKTHTIFFRSGAILGLFCFFLTSLFVAALSDFISISETNAGFLQVGIALTVLTGTTGIFLWGRTPSGRLRKDRLLLRLPVFGRILRYAGIREFCDMLALAVSLGTPFPKTFRIVSSAVENTFLQEELKKAEQTMLRSRSVSAPISAIGLFPGIVPRMMQFGEKTDTIEDQLRALSAFYANELDSRLEQISSSPLSFFAITFSLLLFSFFLDLFLDFPWSLN